MPSIYILIAALIVVTAPPAARAAPAVPFDEETLDQINALNQAITDHYEDLQSASEEVESKRAIAKSKIEAIETDLAKIDEEMTQVKREATRTGDDRGLRVIEEHRIEAKSRYLEALAERHAIDLDATSSFEVHGTAILTNLEKLATTLEKSGRLQSDANDEVTRESLASLQQGTAIALSVLEQWGAITRDDPRFRALWATSKVLNRNIRRLQASEGVKATVDLVNERIFVVRSLIDQARALRSALDHQGLLLQVAAQNQMLRLHFNRLGAINGLELPDLEIDDTTRRILEDIEEEPFAASSSEFNDGLAGFDDCAELGVCN